MIVPAPAQPDLGKYEICEEIGHGGMATVYRAHDGRLGRDVAVKVIHRHLRESDEVAARFTSEARAVAMLRHPNIVEVYDVSGEHDAERFLVVELVRGTTLRKLLASRGALPPEIAAAIAMELAAALGHAHARGVIHRDVKPENVLVDLDGGPDSDRKRPPRSGAEHAVPQRDAPVRRRIKLTDFGIAKLLDAQGVTSTGQVLGSPAHMAPEQIEGGDVGPRSDVFGLGVLLYEAMVGRLPFEGKNPAQVLRRVLDGSFTPADRARPVVGAPFSAVLARALGREPDDRYASVEELSNALGDELRRLGFDEPARELDLYLSDTEAWLRGYEGRIVLRLVATGQAARARGDTLVAAADLNRALAYRPDDAELMKQVMGLARRDRARRIALRTGLVLAGSSALGLAAFGVTRLFRPTPELGPGQEDLAVSVRGHDPGPLIAPERATDPGAENATPESSAGSRPTPPVLRSAPATATTQKTRRVQIDVTGVRGGKVRLDGREVPWFGVVHELSLGPHSFEAVPPSSNCCKATGPQTREIVAGDAVLTIEIALPFKDATLSVPSVPDGARVVCSGLFGGELSRAGTRTIPMRSAELTEPCLLIPAPDSGSTTSRKQVTLHPGRTTELVWP